LILSFGAVAHTENNGTGDLGLTGSLFHKHPDGGRYIMQYKLLQCPRKVHPHRCMLWQCKTSTVHN